MRFLIILISSLFLSLPQYGQFTYEHLVVDYESAITYRNLKIVPIRANYTFFDATAEQGTPNVDNYLSLQQALESGQLRIKDRAGVNQLVIDNLSDQPVMLMSGEILTGGKQDRVIGRDFVLEPNSTRNRVPVFCVEKDRWSSAKNWTYYHQCSMHLRRVVDQAQNQNQVWDEIAYELKRDNVKSTTQAYTSHSKNRRYAAMEADYMQAFSFENLSYPSNIVGFIGISGSVVIGCDIFASTELFQREYQSMLFAYVDEVLTYGLPVDIMDGAIKQYADKLLSNERMQKAFIEQYGKVFELEGKIIHITTFNDRETLQDFEGLQNGRRL